MGEAANLAYDTQENLEYQHGFADLQYLFCPGWMIGLLILLLNTKYMLKIEILIKLLRTFR